MRYRVDNIPWYLVPAFWLYAYSAALLMFAVVRTIRITCRFEEVGKEYLNDSPNFIFAFWHHQIFPSFICGTYGLKPTSIINHPAWHMKHIHVILRILGVKKIYLGSTGHGGKEAANRVVQDLKQGYSTVMNPDGPSGPPMQLKKGALHMAAQSGVPILTVKIYCSSEWVFKNSWEGKRFPKPFSKIRVVYGKPIYVTPETIQSAEKMLIESLGL